MGKLARGKALLGRYLLLRRSQWWSAERLRSWQLEKLRQMLANVDEHNAFYRERFAASGFSPRELSRLEDMAALAPVDKTALRGAPIERRLSSWVDPSRLVHVSTSGSTGEPFETPLTPPEKDLRVLMDLRALSIHGVAPRDLLLSFRHSGNIVGWKPRDSFLGLFPRCYAPFKAEIHERLETLFRTDPDVLQGFTSTLVAMAEQIRAHDLRMPPRLRLLVSCAEYLDTQTRRTLTHAFGVPVMNHYGLCEFGYLAWQCPEDATCMHTNSEHFLMEIVDTQGRGVAPGEIGEVVVTAFEQTAMPFVRYRTGDRARWIEGECRCGRHLPRLCLQRGRTVDRLYRADGSEVSPHVFTVMWEGIEGIVQFQAIQESLDLITYRYVAEPGANPRSIEQLLRVRFLAEFGPQTRVRFERVAQISSEETGKLKHILSKVGAAASSCPVQRT